MSRRRQWHPTPVLLPRESHGQRSLVGCSPWDREESDTTERLHFHFSLSCIGEGNGNPLQCSCLENPWDGGAWWAAVSGVAQSRTQLKRLSSSRRYLSVRVSVCLCFFTRVDVSSDLISLLSFPPISPRRWPEYPEVHVSCYLCSVQWLYSGSPFIDIWWPLTAGQVSRPSRR